MSFATLGLEPEIIKALTALGYESPTPIQIKSIPALLGDDDVVAQAQTGSGKTGAFALPILSKTDLKLQQPQTLVLAPTRELAIQVAEAFHSYAKYLKGFHVLPIYGGQDFVPQQKGLKRGAHVVIGTPGRIMDHIRRGNLRLDHIKTLVLDEADEMLKMGFIDDVKWILEQIPHEHQTALFSATMPESIRGVVERYLKQPIRIKITPDKATIPAISQYYVQTFREYKLEALTRFLEIETFEAAIIFTRTKLSSMELAERLESRGYKVSAINGDMTQKLREQVIKNLKQGNLDIVVATGVAARGLDVERISYVINYDIPDDVESYIHRIGRTGRAGREGKSLIFVTPKERWILKVIERMTGQKIQESLPPSREQVQEVRLQQFVNKVKDALAHLEWQHLRSFVKTMTNQLGYSELDLAAALIAMMQHKQISQDKLENAPADLRNARPPYERDRGGDGRSRKEFRGRGGRGDGGNESRHRRRRRPELSRTR